MGVGTQLKALLDSRGLSLAKAASLTDIPRSTLRSLCARSSDAADVSVLVNLARGLDVPLAYFLGNEEPERYKGSPPTDTGRKAAVVGTSPVRPDSPVTDITPKLSMALEGRYRGVRIPDESMLPRHAPGEVALLDRERKPELGDVAVFRTDTGTIFRIVGGSHLLPVNPLFPPVPDPEKYSCLGVVVGALRI